MKALGHAGRRWKLRMVAAELLPRALGQAPCESARQWAGSSVRASALQRGQER